jgi:hypothetical protein
MALSLRLNPHHRRPIHHGLRTRTTVGPGGRGSVRVLHPDEVTGGWCEFAGAGNTSGVRNPEVDMSGLLIRWQPMNRKKVAGACAIRSLLVAVAKADRKLR